MKKGGASSQPASPGNTPISEDWVRCVLGEDAYVKLDGREWHPNTHERVIEDGSSASSVAGLDDLAYEPTRKRRRVDSSVIGTVEVEGAECKEKWEWEWEWESCCRMRACRCKNRSCERRPWTEYDARISGELES